MLAAPPCEDASWPRLRALSCVLNLVQGMVDLEQRLQQQAAALEAQRAQQAEQWAEYEVQRARLAQLVLDRGRLDELVRRSRPCCTLCTS